MSTDTYQAVAMTERVLKNAAGRKRGLTELEKLAIDSIIHKRSYRQASIEHQYTESSFQNAASRIFKGLAAIARSNSRISRRNFLVLLEQEYEKTQAANSDGQIVFDRLVANLWIGDRRAHLASIGYESSGLLDLNGYLVTYSPKFEATFCLDVNREGSPMELLWDICRLLQVDWGVMRQHYETLLELVQVELQKRRTLLVLRFDRSVWRAVQMDRSEYAEVLMALALLESGSCVLTIDRDPMVHELEVKRSLVYQLRLRMEQWEAGKNGGRRLVAIENDRLGICNVLETYLR